MTSETLDHLRPQISTLSESERAALARELIMSLDGPRDDSVEQSWNDEIVRRVSKVKSGKATLLSREEFRLKMRARLARNSANGKDTGRSIAGSNRGSSKSILLRNGRGIEPLMKHHHSLRH